MENGEERAVNPVRLAWKPIFHPEVQRVFQRSLMESAIQDWTSPEFEMQEYWYIELGKIAEVCDRFLEECQGDAEDMKYYKGDAFCTLFLEDISALNDELPAFPQVFPFDKRAELEGVVEGQDCVFIPYELLKDGGYLLHTREEYLRLFMEFAMAAQTINPPIPAPPAFGVEHPSPTPE